MIVCKCDLCGKEFDMWDKHAQFGLHYEVGYGSKYDGENIDIDICCNCFDRLMTEYIEPKRKNINTAKGGET